MGTALQTNFGPKQLAHPTNFDPCPAAKNPIQKPGAAAEDVPESSDAYWNLSAATPLSEKSPADVTNLS